MVVANFKRLKLEEGNLQLKLKYAVEQSAKSVLLCVPIFTRTLSIDKNAEVLVT